MDEEIKRELRNINHRECTEEMKKMLPELKNKVHQEPKKIFKPQRA